MKVLAIVVFIIAMCFPWVYNTGKLLNCDFKSDYRCEVIHGAGFIVPPLSFVTAWFDSDSTQGGNN